MMRSVIARPIGAVLSIIMAGPFCAAQNPPASATTQTPAISTPALAPASKVPATPLSITVLEGNDAVNSISLLRSVAPVIEVHDSNDFPVEGATVTFTLPTHAPGGTFAQGGKIFSTRSDARGQAGAPLFVPDGAGKFQISVTAVLGERKGEATITQTNGAGAYIGPVIPPKAWYKKKSVWIIAGSVVAVGAVLAVVLTRGSSSSSGSPTVIVTPGSPVFH